LTFTNIICNLELTKPDNRENIKKDNDNRDIKITKPGTITGDKGGAWFNFKGEIMRNLNNADIGKYVSEIINNRDVRSETSEWNFQSRVGAEIRGEIGIDAGNDFIKSIEQLKRRQSF